MIYISRYCFLILLIATSVCVSSCATIVSDKTFPVALNSTPSGAKVEVVDKKGITRFSGATPATAVLDSGDGYFGRGCYSIKFSAPGYTDYSSQIRASMNGWYWGNIVFGGLIGFLIVDPLTGAMYEIDEKVVNASLSPQLALPSPIAPVPPVVPLPAAQPSVNKSAEDVTKKLSDLKSLRDSGIITGTEYQQKRKEVIEGF